MSWADPIRPYANLIKVVMLCALVAGSFAAGCSRGAAGERADVAAELSTKDGRIASLERSIKDFIALYDRMNAQAAETVRLAHAQATNATAAAKVAVQAEAKARAEADAFEDRWAEAKRKPDCHALLTTDMEAVCGVSLR